MDFVAGKRLLVFYHSEGARVVLMANQIGEGARARAVEADVESLVNYDGIVVGSLTYSSNVS